MKKLNILLMMLMLCVANPLWARTVKHEVETAKGIKFYNIEFTGGIEYHKNSQVKSGLLASDTSIDGIKYSEWFHVFLYENGQVKKGKLAKKTTINGVKYVEGTVIQFYDNKQIQQQATKKILSISSIKRLWNKYSNKKVESVILSKATFIKGVEYPQGTYVRFDEYGNVKEVVAKTKKKTILGKIGDGTKTVGDSFKNFFTKKNKKKNKK